MSSKTAAPAVREVTDAEAAFYQENGWVLLEQLITPDQAGEILEHLQEKMGPHGEITSHPEEGRNNGKGSFFNTWSPLSVDVASGAVLDEYFNDFSHSESMARAGTRLQGEPVRFWVDQALVKVPISRSELSDITDWHVDISSDETTPFANPSAQSLIWFALNEIPPERGSMRFVAPKDQSDEVWRIAREMSLEDSYVALEQMGVLSPALTLKPGDVTVHAGRTMHSALKNTTDEPRWAYQTIVFPARCTWTGNVYWPNAGTEMTTGEVFPDHRFPILT